jgi:hypothetical protein
MEELIAFLKSRIADANQSVVALRADSRHDEAALEQIRGNIYGIFVSVAQAAKARTTTPEELRAFFEGNLERIPSSWAVAREKAEAAGDTVRVVQEDVKLAAIQEVRDAYARLCGDAQ